MACWFSPAVYCDGAVYYASSWFFYIS